MISDRDILELARSVLLHEAGCIEQASERLSISSFAAACRLIIASKGRVAVLGVGKSGLIGRKIAATLSSTGTPAFFVHAAEAGHGDLGMITSDDVVLALSNSGETEETCNVAPLLKRFGATIIALTGNDKSTLAQYADFHIDAAVAREACPLNLAPTASTAVQLAIGDALAMVVLRLRGFTDRDFAKTHPGGALGRSLYLRVCDVMSTILEAQCVSLNEPIEGVIRAMSLSRGVVLVFENSKSFRKLRGIFTDSDLRRLVGKLSKTADNLNELTAEKVMIKNPLTISEFCLGSEALRIMEERNISRLPVVRDDTVVGTIRLHDLLMAKIF